MTATYTPISSVTLNSSASSFGFTNIPATYRDIIVKIAARSNGGPNVHDNFYFTVNGNRTSLWVKSVYGVGNTYGGIATSGNSTYLTSFPAGAAYSNVFSCSEWIFGRYSSGLYATLLVDSTSENNTSNGQNYIGGMLWEDGTPISSLTWYNYNGNDFAAGTTAYLYGIGT